MFIMEISFYLQYHLFAFRDYFVLGVGGVYDSQIPLPPLYDSYCQ